MKKYFLLSMLFLSVSVLKAQLTITPNQTASYLANKLVATSGTLGVTVSNAILTCDTNANGDFTGISNLGIADGIVLGTGDVLSNSIGGTFGLNGLPSDFASTTMSAPGDTQLTTVVGAATFDACVLEFDLQPVGSFVEFEYVFGSEEYPSFNCSPFNDVFGFFISGPGFSTTTNIALIPMTTTPVSINSINDGSVTTCLADTSLYVTNNDTTCTMNGFTVPLIAHANVTSGSTYHLKMAIADVMDGVLNSYVVIKANSLKSGGNTPNGINTQILASGLEVSPTILDNTLSIQSNRTPWEILIYDINGRLVKHININSNQSQSILNVSDLSKGMYLLTAINQIDFSKHSTKLIKN